MFMDWKNKYCQNVYATQSDLCIQCNPYQNAINIFHRAGTNNLNICFFNEDFIYLLIGQRERERAHKQGEGQAEGEADSLLSKEPDAGLDPSTLGS